MSLKLQLLKWKSKVCGAKFNLKDYLKFNSNQKETSAFKFIYLKHPIKITGFKNE